MLLRSQVGPWCCGEAEGGSPVSAPGAEGAHLGGVQPGVWPCPLPLASMLTRQADRGQTFAELSFPLLLGLWGTESKSLSPSKRFQAAGPGAWGLLERG